MTTETTDERRREVYEIAEAIAPTWERRRAEIEELSTPVREWMLRELRPRPGDTLLELAAGTGDTGLEVAAVIGERGGCSRPTSRRRWSRPRAAAAPSSG